MLNEDLLDKTSIRIAKLTNTIRSFKKYDKQRKLYYSKALKRLSELEKLSDSMIVIKKEIKEKNATIKGLKQVFSTELINKDFEIRSLKLKIEELRKNME